MRVCGTIDIEFRLGSMCLTNRFDLLNGKFLVHLVDELVIVHR